MNLKKRQRIIDRVECNRMQYEDEIKKGLFLIDVIIMMDDYEIIIG